MSSHFNDTCHELRNLLGKQIALHRDDPTTPITSGRLIVERAEWKINFAVINSAGFRTSFDLQDVSDTASNIVVLK